MTGAALHDGQSLTIPTCPKGIGKLILTPDSSELIAGVKVHLSTLWPDDRGYFLELLRIGQGPTAEFDPARCQVSAACSYPGTIKAFHYHSLQTDFWAPVAGMLQVALVDLRLNSTTHGLKNTLFVGMLRPWQILIPPGVAHGYKVIGTEAAMLVYLTDRFYNPEDEGRLAFNHVAIGYDWETQHK